MSEHDATDDGTERTAPDDERAEGDQIDLSDHFGRPDRHDQNAPGSVVVGIGASAGGLKALRQMLRKVERDSELVWVVVVHLAPTHESHLSELLQRECSLPVLQVTEDTSLEQGHVYVIPPGHHLNTIDTHLRLSDPEDTRPVAPIDHFLHTLAETHGEDAVGVILTGTGADGTSGLEAIKGVGGLTIAQDPEEAEFDGMPRSAIASGYVDLVLPLDAIPQHIIDYAAVEPDFSIPADGETLGEQEDRTLQRIFAQIRSRTGHDVSGYKRTTVLRRIRRRMQLRSLTRLHDYLQVLVQDDQELRSLFDDLLITVTSFFRDAETFEYLETHVVPRLFDGKSASDSVRVWTVGCSTGEEAYSLAILLLEESHRRQEFPTLQVFASDLHQRSLQRAREGVYPETIEADVPARFLDRYFTKENGSYRINKEVREVVVFASHNVLREPPFSHLDFISCRNVLIYLQRDVQFDIIKLFHYALDPGGFLFLGSSETVDRSDLFVTESKDHRIFARREVPTKEPELPVFVLDTRDDTRTPPQPTASARGAPGAIHERMVELYAPPSVLVDADNRILHSSARAGRYLRHPGGEPTTDLVRLIRDELRMELRTALHMARERGAWARSRRVPVRADGETREVAISVQPAPGDGELRGLYLVMLDDSEADLPIDGGLDEVEVAPQDAAADELRKEPELAHRRFQSLVEEYEAGQEEMRASNEELQSMNEELRSTMEELETSKEELQSMNEELNTVNQENRHKVEELSQLSSDLQNLLVSTDIATLFLDRDLRILRFTPRVGDLVNIRHSDRGRPLSDLTDQLGYDGLQADTRQVLDRLVPIEREVQADDGRWFLTRLLPYRTTEDRIDGVVITFVDISARKAAEAALRESEQRLRLALEASNMGTWTWDLAEGTFTLDARSLLVLGLPADAELSLETLLNEIVDRTDRTELRRRLEQAAEAADRRQVRAELRIHRPDGQRRWVLLTGQKRLAASAASDESVTQLTGTILDITARKELERSLQQQVEAQGEEVRATERRYQALVEASSVIVGLDGPSGSPFGGEPRWCEFTGQTTEESAGDGWLDAVHPNDRTVAELRWQQGLSTGTQFEAEARIRSASGGGWRWVYLRGVPLHDPDGDVRGWMGMATDIHERKEAEEKVRLLASELTMAEHEERRRIAQILHDDLQQRLHSIQMRGGLLAERVGDDAEGAGTLAEMLTALESSVELTRRLAIELSPPVLEDEGLFEALHWLAGQMEEMHGLHVELRSEGSVRLEDHDMRVFLFQIVRELLFNVVKHAGVDHASVDLRRSDRHLTITVADRGRGFDPEAAIRHVRRTDSLGLASVQERLALFDGRMDIDTAPGRGARIVVAVGLEKTHR